MILLSYLFPIYTFAKEISPKLSSYYENTAAKTPSCENIGQKISEGEMSIRKLPKALLQVFSKKLLSKVSKIQAIISKGSLKQWLSMFIL